MSVVLRDRLTEAIATLGLDGMKATPDEMQPLTQLFKINEGHEIAKADRAIAESDARKTEDEIIFSVHQLYYGLLIAQKQKEAAQSALAAAQEGMRESEDALKAGNVLDVVLTQSKVQLLQNRQSLLTAEIQTSDLMSELNDLLGLPLDTELVLAEIEDGSVVGRSSNSSPAERLLSSKIRQKRKKVVCA